MRIAVCIPVYRPPSWYEVTCLASVMRAMCRAVRAGHDVSLLIGADGCEDARARTLAFGLPVLWSPANVGCYVMRNSLHDAAGDVDAFAYFDADNWMHPDHLTLHAEALPPGGVTAPHSINVDEASEKRWSIFAGGGGLISREAWEVIGGYLPARVHADKDAALRWEMAGTPCATVDAATWRRYVWGRSLTRDPASNMASDLRATTQRAAAGVRESGVVRVPRVVVPLTEIQP